MNRRKGGTAVVIILFVLGVLGGCATTESVAYTFPEEGTEQSSVTFSGGNPGVAFISCEAGVLPPAEKGTRWNPVVFPSGKETALTVHVYYQQINTSTSLLGALISDAVTASRSVDGDIEFNCPALENGGEYELEFKKEAGVPGKNVLILTDVKNGKETARQEF